MKTLLVLLLTLFGIAMSIEYNYEDGVVVLTKDNFGPTMSSLKYAMVLFYPPDELAVSPLVNSYPEAAKMITEELPGVKLCKMDAVEYPGYAKSYAGSQFELSLQFFRKGNPKPMSYTAGIRAHEISQWVAETIDESIPLVSSTEELQELLKKNKHVGLYFESNDNELYLKFLGFSTMVNDVAFAKSDSRSLMNKYGASENSFVLFREFGEEYNIYNGELTPEKLDKFVRVYKESAVLHLNAATAKKINTGVMDLVFFLRDKSPESIELQKKFSSFANQNREKLSFVVGVAGETYGDKALTKFGYTKEMLPAVAIYHVSDNLRKYRFDRPINEKNLNIFLSNFFAKNLIPYTMSSEIQAEYDGAIMILVGRTYNDIVLDDTKDVLVEWYSPDCRHCKKFAPKYQELAEKLKGIPDLVIAKIDALSNEVDGIEIWGYPTLKLYPKDRKNSPIDYTGKETVNDMIKFLKERGTVTIDV